MESHLFRLIFPPLYGDFLSGDSKKLVVLSGKPKILKIHFTQKGGLAKNIDTDRHIHIYTLYSYTYRHKLGFTDKERETKKKEKQRERMKNTRSRSVAAGENEAPAPEEQVFEEMENGAEEEEEEEEMENGVEEEAKPELPEGFYEVEDIRKKRVKKVFYLSLCVFFVCGCFDLSCFGLISRVFLIFLGGKW